jgi:hypothetical protein
MRSWISVNGVPRYPLKRRELEPFLNFDEIVERLKDIAGSKSASVQERNLAGELLAAAREGEERTL